MAWSSSKVKKYLAEACQLHGLHLREVQAGYTSRQDSRTGAPGIRCQDVPVADFVRPGGYLWKRVLKAAKEVEEKGEKASAENRLFAGLHRRWDEKGKTWTDAGNVKWTFGPGGKLARNNGAALDRNKGEAPAPVRVPQRGGELFVSAQPCACDACRHTDRKGLPALQADLNAAANIGLRALLDPDFPGRWWYVPCDPNSGIPVADKVKGSILDNVGPLFSPTPAAGTDEAGKRERGGKRPARQREVVYRWRDPQTSAIRGREGGETWEETTVYWNQAQWRAIEILRTQVEP
jgi:hypothetical protein